MNSICRYFKRVSTHEYAPGYYSRRDFVRHKTENEFWCPSCQAVVEIEMKLDVRGMIEACPWCGSEAVSAKIED